MELPFFPDGALFWICNQNSVNDTSALWLLLSSACTGSEFSLFPALPPQQAGWKTCMVGWGIKWLYRTELLTRVNPQHISHLTHNLWHPPDRTHIWADLSLTHKGKIVCWMRSQTRKEALSLLKGKITQRTLIIFSKNDFVITGKC